MIPSNIQERYKTTYNRNDNFKKMFEFHENNLENYLLNGFPNDKSILFFDDSILQINNTYLNCPPRGKI